MPQTAKLTEFLGSGSLGAATSYRTSPDRGSGGIMPARPAVPRPRRKALRPTFSSNDIDHLSSPAGKVAWGLLPAAESKPKTAYYIYLNSRALRKRGKQPGPGSGPAQGGTRQSVINFLVTISLTKNDAIRRHNASWFGVCRPPVTTAKSHIAGNAIRYKRALLFNWED